MSLLLLCGIPGAGKTTISKQLSSNFMVEHFSFDEFVDSQLKASTTCSMPDVIDHGFDSEETISDDKDLLKPMKVYRKLWENSIEAYLFQMLDGGDGNLMVILDDNFYLQSQRRNFAKLGKRFGLHICCVKVVVGVEEAQRRNVERISKSDGGRMLNALMIDSNLIMKMDEKFEDSGIDYFYDSKLSNIDDLITFIKIFQQTNPDNFSYPHSPSPSPSSTEQSFLQELDSFSRKITSEIISSGFQRHGKVINNFRRDILEQIKRNEFNFDLNMDTVDCEANKKVFQKILFDKINEFCQ